ncbi:hypothetical protein BDP27DRAFT_1403679 [Rhodocollybia butyracea]|uniref:Uncharacterized protein n=1 Tax=Rhodocollybia butyracea TaxID=206335 RepID=A0A9P5PSK5_9AGAR|nr:hypothetical protein BDP27DRAFT_1403679 [Rhodocollybia butyracea]
MLGDHAKDQKLLSKLLENEQELRGEEALLATGMVVVESTKTAVFEASGAEAWASLSTNEQRHRSEDVYPTSIQIIHS